MIRVRFPTSTLRSKITVRSIYDHFRLPVLSVVPRYRDFERYPPINHLVRQYSWTDATSIKSTFVTSLVLSTT
jgi:hypothetical protein